MAFKLVISDGKSGLSVQKELDDKATKSLIGLKIGDSVKGELIDLQGFELELTGGSDYCGFPMRKDVQGAGRKKILAYQGVGFRKDRKGILQRKTVCGNTVHAKIAQVNLKIIKNGNAGIFDEVKKKLEEKKKSQEKAPEKETGKKVEKTPEKETKKTEENKKPEEKTPEKETKKTEENKKPEEKTPEKETKKTEENKKPEEKTPEKETKKTEEGKKPKGASKPDKSAPATEDSSVASK